MKFKEAFDGFFTDKSSSHGYHAIYEKVLNVQPKSLLEIGVLKGHSLFAWSALFPECQLTGVDVTTEKFDASVLASGAEIVIHDSTDSKIRDLLGEYDVIIDDGSHFYKHIISTFENLCDRFNQVYIIEDIMGKECLDIIMKEIKKSDKYRMEVYPSKTRKVKVNTHWIWNNVKKGKESTTIDLFMLVVYKS